MIVRKQGIFKEMIHGSDNELSIFNFVQPVASEDEEKIINYLGKR